MFNVKKKILPICITAAAACVIALAGCANNDGMTGGVAATVNGTDIAEDKVTSYIEEMRSNQGLSTDEDWAEYLNSMGYTPESLREAVIDMYVTQELEKAAAAEAGVEVTDEEIDAVVSSMRSNYDSDEAWQEALKSVGLTEETYRENVYLPMLEEKLQEAVITEDKAKADDETVLSYVQMYGSALDGMKRSSHILFAADDEETAKKVLEELKNGADFAEMAKKYSTDSSKDKGGDSGWEGLSGSFVTAYSEALEKLDKGETSDLVNSEFGIHIIRCTDVWHAPKEIKKLSDVPEELVETVRTQMADPAAKQTAFSEYLEDLRKKADIHINDLPKNASYIVDMSKYESSESTSADGEDVESGEESADEAGDEIELVDEDGNPIDSDDVEIEVEDEGDAAEEGSESTSESTSEASGK